MKKTVVLLLSLVVMFFSAHAQEKAKTEIGTVKEAGKNVNFTLTSSQQFRVGGNIYVLHIGDSVFWLNEQSEEGEKGILTFFIPRDDFNNLKDNSNIYLTYGNRSAGEDEMKEMCKEQYSPCWFLGQFNKNMLTK